MLKREWQKISKNPWMIIILIAIITIPAIYTSVFLGSMWDPYGDADQLPVAVVNHDKKVNYEGKTLQVGDDLVKNLKDSGSLDFRFVSDKKAKEGLKIKLLFDGMGSLGTISGKYRKELEDAGVEFKYFLDVKFSLSKMNWRTAR